MAPGAGAIGTVPEVDAPQLKWKLPEGWQELPPRQMRVGNFLVNGEKGQKAEISIIPLGGMGGGDLENVNRWRGQVSQPRLSAEELGKIAEPVEIAGTRSQLFDFAGETPDEGKKTRIVAAILHREDTAWFFKMLGDDTLTEAQKPAFVAFLKSVSFGPALPPSHPPIGNAMAGAGAGAGALAPPSAGAKPSWEVPAGWQETAVGPMQLARFTAADSAEVTVTMLPGEAGGVGPNVNRWRGQIGLSPLSDAELQQQVATLEIPEAARTYVLDAVNEQTKRRLVAVGILRHGSTWFYKMVGDAAAVGAQKAAFLKFIQSAKYGA